MNMSHHVSWINPKIVIQAAGAKGSGSFVTEAVHQGEILIVQGGRIVESSTLDRPDFEPYAYHCFQVEHDFYICPVELTHESADGVFQVNHSCEPTAGLRGQITLVAMRNLAPGEEVTFDYVMTDAGTHEEGWEDMECLCGTASCRQFITGTDWQNPELQAKYAGYFSPHIQNLINQHPS
jgi:uncharacterized protein